ncbi:MAG: NAD-dependent epimerase/dehydratase family protein [Candidatus Paceibacterota bacterium]|jgi:nucleoside-diphosphate-sugar epimerase
MNKHTIFIAGAAGYVGAMLCDQFSKREDVDLIIGLDKEIKPKLLEGNEKVFWITGNTSDGLWQEKVSEKNPDVVINVAWQIREMYGKKEKQWKWNVEGSDAVFDFCFTNSSVKKLIYFSTVSSYGAFSDNSLEHYFKEEEPFREMEYLYGVEKKVVEEHLKEKFNSAKSKGQNVPQVFVVRPAAITGPRGRAMEGRFGLQSALSGNLKGSFVYKIVTLLTAVVPATPKWCRQFIHEDDVADIVTLFTFNDLDGEYEVFNICPPGQSVLSHDMASAVGKRVVIISPLLVRVAFFILWHLSRGKIPTSRGGWKFYSYPVVVDGTRLSNRYGFKYSSEPLKAFVENKGRYAK